MQLNLQLGALVAVAIIALYVFVLIIKKAWPEKRHQYTGGVDDQGRYDGVGKLVAINGDVYTGDFSAGTFHGNGTYVFKKGGGSYTGQFRDGLFAGQGKEIYPDGSKYVGGFDNSKRSGHGTMHYQNGAVYTGPWRAGKKEGGPGKFLYSDGTRFEGRFTDGRRDGVGFIYDKKNRKLQGKWKNGQLTNNGKLTRVLHSTGTPQPDQAPIESTEEEDREDELLDAESATARASTPKLRQRYGVSSHQLPPGSLSLSRKSAQRQTELTNQLLNFSKRSMTQSAGAMMSDSMSAQDRERSKLIAELARAHASANNSTATTSSSNSSSTTQSLSASVSASPAITPGPRASGRVDSRLEDVPSSGMESELGGTSAFSESEGEKHGEWTVDTPTHVSNAVSLNPTPTPSRLSLASHPIGSPRAQPRHLRRDYLSSGSEKEGASASDVGNGTSKESPSSTASAELQLQA